VVHLEYEEQTVPDEIVQSLRVEIDGDVFTLDWMDGVYRDQFRFAVDANRTPSTIDRVDPRDPARLLETGIYRWDGEHRLTLCLRAWQRCPDNARRPTEFRTNVPGAALTLMQLRRAQPAPADGAKRSGTLEKHVTVRGILRVGEAPARALDLANSYVVADSRVPLTGVRIALLDPQSPLEARARGIDVYLPDETLHATAQQLNGRPVVLTGQWRTMTVIPPSYRDAPDGVELRSAQGHTVWVPTGGDLPVRRHLIVATELRAPDGSYEPWTGEPATPNWFLSGAVLQTFRRQPKARDVIYLHLTPEGNLQLPPLHAANFPALLDALVPIRANDPAYRLWAFAPWYRAEFETAEGRFGLVLYLGGLGVLFAPDGTHGLVQFEHPK
jgi:uncharacterized protein (TIGR03067 family)